MRHSLSFFLMANFCFVTQLLAQDVSSRVKKQNVLVPMDTVLVATIAEPECPLVVENVRLLKDVGGRTPGFYAYQLRNIGTKSITAYALSVSYSDATGSSLKLERIEGGLLPDHTIPAPSMKLDLELVPLSKELRHRLGLDKVQPLLAVLMVEHIYFADGSSYHSEKLSSAVQRYFLKVNGFATSDASKLQRNRYRPLRREIEH
jgi:hypothetical protein